MTEKIPAPKGRPVTNKMDQIPASPEHIAKAIFRAADKKINLTEKKKPKPN